MAQIPSFETLIEIAEAENRIRRSMHAGNEIRRVVGHADAMVRIALSEFTTSEKL